MDVILEGSLSTVMVKVWLSKLFQVAEISETPGAFGMRMEPSTSIIEELDSIVTYSLISACEPSFNSPVLKREKFSHEYWNSWN